jgi:hypothetical protein
MKRRGSRSPGTTVMGGKRPREGQSELEAIAAADGLLDLVAISHVDEDHITGVLDLFALLQDQRTNGDAELIGVDGVWHNSFSTTVDPDGEIEPQFNALRRMNRAAAPASAAALFGIGEGNRLRQLALQLDTPLNEQFAGSLIRVEDAPDPLEFDNLTLRIVGPTQANLDELQTDWLEWLDEFGPDLASGNPLLMANADNSVPNLSSVMFLATADDKTVLFTGDGRSDHLLQGLEARGLLAADGTLHVDVLKVMHHGSDRNATRTFFKRVTADTYVLSANGTRTIPISRPSSGSSSRPRRRAGRSTSSSRMRRPRHANCRRSIRQLNSDTGCPCFHQGRIPWCSHSPTEW